MASPRWMRACRIPPCEAHLGYSNGAQSHWVAGTKVHGCSSGCLWPARMVYPAVGAFASPCEGRVERLDLVLASGCSSCFLRHPSWTVFLERRAGTFPRGCVDSVVLGGNQNGRGGEGRNAGITMAIVAVAGMFFILLC